MAFTVAPCLASRPVVAARPARRLVSVCASRVAEPAALPVKAFDGTDGNANTKTRAEVRGGGKKPFKQKGTGNARAGSSTTPLKPGGGVSFGPRTKDWSISMNKKERRLALATALQSAAADIIVVDTFDGKMPDRKTKSLVTACNAMGVDVMTTHTLIVTAGDNRDVFVSARNVAKLKVNQADFLQMYDVLRADKIIMERGALELINSAYGGEDRSGESDAGEQDEAPAADDAASEPSTAE